MAYESLREWIAALERANELKQIGTEVDPILEITEIADRVSKKGGPALLFRNIKGRPGARVLINQFGSARRMNLALEVDALDEVADRIRHFMDVKSPQGFLDKVKMLPMLAGNGEVLPQGKSQYRPLQRGHSKDRFFARLLPDSAVLAEGRRKIHHLSMRNNARSQDRQAKWVNVPHAGL